MERSELESIGNNELYYLIKLISNNYDLGDIINDSKIMTDGDFITACDEAIRVFGKSLEFPIDYDYLASVIKLNQDFDFTGKKPSGVLNKPIPNLYSFDIDEFRTEWVRRTYRDTITSYSKEIVFSTIKSLVDSNGYDMYENKEIDVDYYDGETTDVKLDKDSISLINR
jgi:hypothetical protein